jgi:peptidyl-tRNA hydrolase, PTH1 family
MAGPKRLIVGLGNPGVEYEGTRHNVGFEVVDRLAATTGAVFKRDGQALVAPASIRGRSAVLAKPQTYMNLSGVAVKQLAQRYGLIAPEVLVVVDDINLPPGMVRIRQRGSAGGHNGLQDIIERLGSDDFPRIRIGVGNDFPRGRQADYVLSPFTASERPVMDEAVQTAAEAASAFLIDGLMAAMNRYNQR